MDTNRLKAMWQEREAGPTPDARGDVARVAQRFTAWRRHVRFRDYREHAAAVACMLFFGRLAFVLPSTVARVAAAYLVGTSALSIVKLIRANPGRQQTDKAVAVREFCENELRRIDVQIRLLRSVPYWAVGPVLVGVNVMVAALSPRLIWTLLYLPLTLILGTWVCYLNRQAVRRYLVPLRNELLRTLRDES